MRAVNIIAEIGSVHDGSFGNAIKLVELAARIGCDTVKFQTHIPEAETTRSAPSPSYFSGEDRFSYFRRTGFSSEQWRNLRSACKSNGVRFLSSPFSVEAVHLLEDVGVHAYKVASGEVTNTPLLEEIARTGKPVLLSSGMSDWLELDKAVDILGAGGGGLTVLQCTSAYPCPPERVGLNVISEMQARYRLPVGFSDHTDGIAAALAAVTLGATVVEKHLTFSRSMYGSDAANAAEPHVFAQMIHCIREITRMLGSEVDKNDLAPYREMKQIFEKSVVTRRAVAAGEILSMENLTTKKPGSGTPAAEYSTFIGRITVRSLPEDHLITTSDLQSITDTKST